MGKLSADLIEEYFATHLPIAPAFCWRITV
jgi:hypothetical protein